MGSLESAAAAAGLAAAWGLSFSAGACAHPARAEPSTIANTASLVVVVMRSPETSSCNLRCFKFPVSNLLELVEQGLVADLQLFGGAAAVPAGAVEHAQDQLFFGLARGGAGSLLERNPVAV